MEEIHQVTALLAKLHLHLVRNPGRAIAHRMEMTPRPEPGLRRTPPPLPAAFLDPAGKIPPEHRGGTAFRMDEVQTDFFPAQHLPLAPVFGIGRRLHHRHHRTIQLADKNDTRRRPGPDLPRRLLFVNPLGVLLGGPLNRAHRHLNPVVFLQLVRHPSKRGIRLKITEGTVKVHVKHLLRKLDLGSRVEAAVWAVRNGFRR
ncbi:MAG: LuxR C-terminal-related transcriptional regulator [Candidatus Competibacter sp.]